VDEGDGGGSLADRGCDPLHRSVANVAGGEHPGERARQPVGTGHGADEDVRGRHRQGLAVAAAEPPHRDRGEVAVALDRHHLGLQVHLDPGGPLYAVDEVAGHVPGEAIAEHQQVDAAGVPREMERGLPRGVATADHGDVLACAQCRLGCVGAVVQPAALEAVGASGGQAPVADPAGDHHRASGPSLAAGVVEHPVGAADLEMGDVPGCEHHRAESPRLRQRPPRQLAPAHPGGEAEVVFDPGAQPRLPARSLALDHRGGEALGGGVYRGGEPGGPGADDHHVVEGRLGPGGEAETPGELLVRGVAQPLASGQQHQRQRAGLAAGRLEEAVRLGVDLQVVPGEGHLVAGEVVAGAVAVGVPSVAHQTHPRGARSVLGGPVVEEVVEHRAEPVLGGIPRLHHVVVDRAGVDRTDCRLGLRVRGQQHRPGALQQVADPGEEVEPGHRRQALIGDHQRHRLTGPCERAQRRHCPRTVWCPQDAEAVPVATAQVSGQGAQGLGVVPDREQDGASLGHRLLTTPRGCRVR
jgi:hypothetical protein